MHRMDFLLQVPKEVIMKIDNYYNPRAWRCAAALLTVALASFVQPAAAAGDGWPAQPIRLIVPFAPGGGSDLVGRVLGQHLGGKLDVSIVVENRPGAGGSIGAAQVARAAPDGYTLLLGSSSEVVQYPAVNPRVSYDALEDFVPVSQVATVPLVLVAGAQTDVVDVPSLVSFAKEQADIANYGSAGVGSSTHLAMALLLSKTGVEMNHVPYKGSAGVVTDLLAGNLHVAMPTLSAVLAYRDDPRVRMLAVSTAERHSLVSEMPGMEEAGLPDYDISLWTGILAPRGTPEPIIIKLNETISEVLALPEVQQALAQQGAQAQGGTAEAFAEKIREEAVLWMGVVAEAGISLQ